jgi:peptidoglycan/xylan/chitin deacetylase (PgdA/CDA1 family)
MRGDLILAYHRVIDVDRDPQLMCVSPSRFAEHLDALLHEGYEIVSLKEIASAPSTKRRAAITFDDGYADNLEFALPALQERDRVATVFVTTRNAEEQREFWWDEIEGILLTRAELPTQLDLRIDGLHLRGEVPADCSHETAHLTNGWSVAEQFDPTPRHSLYRDLCRLLRPALPEVRGRAIEALRDWAGRGPEPRPTHRPLIVDEVCALSAAGIEIGAHTVEHPVLASLAHEQQRDEIAGSRDQLWEWTGQPIVSFSYPYGRRSALRSGASRLTKDGRLACDYTTETVNTVREAGFALACANSGGVVTARSKALELQRVLVRDWNGDEFIERLERFLGLRHRLRGAVAG